MSKDEFFNIFKLLLLQAKSNSEKLGCLQSDGGRKFIRIILKEFCNKGGIEIDYVISYIHEENGIAKRYWQTLSIIKDSLLIDSKLSIYF